MEKIVCNVFLDTEFNCTGGKYQEPVSIGCVVTNRNHKIINKFYSTIRPVKT